MLEIDLRKEPQTDRELMYVNGEQSESSYARDESLYVNEEVAFVSIENIRTRDILGRFTKVSIRLEEIDEVPIYVCLSKSMTYPVTRKHPTVSASIDYMVEFWAKPWSIYDQLHTMQECIEEIEGVEFLCEIREDDAEIGPIYDALNGFGVVLPVVDLDISIGSVYRICMDTLRKVHTDAEVHLASELDPERLVTYFSFPPSIRIACEQYLVYFSQFLIDVGINAEADLTSTGGMTLFKVKPKDNEQALNDIRELLSAYLQIGTNGNVDVTTYGNNDASVL